MNLSAWCWLDQAGSVGFRGPASVKKTGVWRMKRILVVAGMLLLGVGAVVAQQDVVKETQNVMKGNGKNAGAMAAMLKGEKPYDQATVDTALAQFEDTAKKLPTLFPASTKGLKPEGDYSASPKIRDDTAGFTTTIASFANAGAEGKH